MNRSELINELCKVPICAIPTVITMDVGLQYDYITAEGAGTSLGNMGEWPAFKLKGIPTDRWMDIKAKVKNKALSEADLEGTELGLLVENLHRIYGEMYSQFYPDLLIVFLGGTCMRIDLPFHPGKKEAKTA